MDEHTHHTHHPGGHHKTIPHKLPPYSAFPQFESWLEEYLGIKAPQLPENWRAAIAKFGPWVTLIILILTLPTILALFGFGLLALPMATMVGYHHGAWGFVVLIFTAISLVLEAMALPGLFKRAKQGWVYIFYASLVSGVANLLGFNLGSIVGAIISLYIIFQVKNQYK